MTQSRWTSPRRWLSSKNITTEESLERSEAPGHSRPGLRVTAVAAKELAALARAGTAWLEAEATFLSLAESQLALAVLASLCAGERDAIAVLRRLLRRVKPTLVPT
jgi:hypothetical protein